MVTDRPSGPSFGRSRERSPELSYVLEGAVLEVSATSSAGRAGRHSGTPSVAAWQIRMGTIGDVDVCGQAVVVLLANGSARPGATPARVLLLDEGASPEQVLALLDAFGGRLGGPLIEIIPPVAEERGFAQVPLEYRTTPGRAEVLVLDRLNVAVRLGPAGSEEPTSTGQRSGIARVRLRLPDHDLAWDTDCATATYRSFHFVARSPTKEADMGAMTPDQMDRVIADHFAAEGAHDIEGLLATLTDDAEHDVVGLATEPRRGKESIRDYYEQQVFKVLRAEEVRPLRRYYGEDFMVDEVLYTGDADGKLFGADGHHGQVSFRLLHVIEFRDGRIARENVWLDSQTARQQLVAG